VERDAQDPASDIVPAPDRAPGGQTGGIAGVSSFVTHAAERQRRHRERIRAGRIPLAIEADGRVIEALLVTGAISEAESFSRHAVEAALGEMVDEWTQRALASP
jgi:hypothetical protein